MFSFFLVAEFRARFRWYIVLTEVLGSLIESTETTDQNKEHPYQRPNVPRGGSMTSGITYFWRPIKTSFSSLFKGNFGDVFGAGLVAPRGASFIFLQSFTGTNMLMQIKPGLNSRAVSNLRDEDISSSLSRFHRNVPENECTHLKIRNRCTLANLL